MKAGTRLMKQRALHSSLNSMAFTDTAGKYHEELGEICLAFWYYLTKKDTDIKGFKEIVLSLEQSLHGSYALSAPDMDAYKAYLRFILTKSKYKDAIISKSVAKAFREGVYFNVDAPYNHVQCAIVAIRRGWEFPKKTKMWYALTKAGVCPNLALVMSYYLSFDAYGNAFFKSDGQTSNHELFGFDAHCEAIQHYESELNKERGTYRDKPFYDLRIFNSHMGGNQIPKNYDFTKIVKFSREYRVFNSWDSYQVDFKKTVASLKQLQKELNG